jgi:purine-nucleoside phosphorylase
MENTMAVAFELADHAGERIGEVFGRHHDILVVLGSGWSESIPVLQAASSTPPQSVDVTEIPGFAKPSALGHGGTLVSITVGDTAILLLTGRTHLYEGHGVHAVVHGIRSAHTNGCRAVLLTNGAGCLRPEWPVGTPVMIADHINMTGHSPLTGDNPPSPHAGRFVDLTDAYSRELRDVVRGIEPSINEAVYIGLHGPHFDTPAEIRAMATCGADMVGMSTVLEVIAARHLAMNVLALSLATNQAAGMSGEKLSGEEVIAVGKEAAPRVAELLRKILVALDASAVLRR